MAIPTPASNLSGLALRIVREGLIPAGEAERLQTEANTKKIPLVSHLVSSKKLNSATIARISSEEFGVPLFDVTALDPDSVPTKLVDEKILRKHNAMPLFKRGNKLYVGVTDPTNLQALDEIKFNTGLTTEPVLVDETRLTGMLDIYLSSLSNRVNMEVRALTVVAMLFMPATLIAGIFGMNFKTMPWLADHQGFWFALGLMASIAGMMALIFWRRQWLSRRSS